MEAKRRELVKKITNRCVEVKGLKGKILAGVIYPGEYEALKFFKSNRPINEDRAMRIGATYEKTGQNISPVVLNKDFDTTDGQHRAWACIELGLPIYINIVENDMTRSDLMIVLNNEMQNLTLDNYFRHCVEEGIPGYKEASIIKAKYGIDVSSLERFLPVTKSQIEQKKPFECPEDLEYHVNTVIKIKEAERKVLSNSRRLSKWASAMVLLENRIKSRIKQSGKNSPFEKAWKKDGYDRIIENLPSVIKTETSNDGTKELAALLSKAFDYRRKNKFVLVETN